MADAELDKARLREQLKAMLRRAPVNGIGTIQQVREFKAWYLKAIKVVESSRSNTQELESFLLKARGIYR